MEKAAYILGHSRAEILRLIKQAAIIRPMTERPKPLRRTRSLSG
jgi:hypothetical protein